MNVESKTYQMRIEELKFLMWELVKEWKSNGRTRLSRQGKIYLALANELEDALKFYSAKEQSIKYVEITE